ncbi:putative holo-acyl-carrier-protein synthase [Rosellinia necatrix]|uniref:Putative holo-acyl-carrier-protein synthase n=1 Tax=Rosellinia necatrix TaxID=77044 RepID=A0A1S7UHZ5_ROSNE|nr:putative holo-acyl-carrier-protein synthase [Rosellinia necatrix]
MIHPGKLPFIIGNDICHAVRIRRILKSGRGPQFVRRILRPEEIDNTTTANILRCVLEDQRARGSRDDMPPAAGAGDEAAAPDPPGFRRAVEFMAGRFAAKEAVIKAHPHRRLTFQMVSIIRSALGMESPEGSPLDDFEEAEKGGITNTINTTTTTSSSSSTTSTAISAAAAAAAAATDRREELVARSVGDEGSGGALVAVLRADDTYEQTFASVSISHDGDYATAVCLGINARSNVFPGMATMMGRRIRRRRSPPASS